MTLAYVLLLVIAGLFGFTLRLVDTNKALQKRIALELSHRKADQAFEDFWRGRFLNADERQKKYFTALRKIIDMRTENMANIGSRMVAVAWEATE